MLKKKVSAIFKIDFKTKYITFQHSQLFERPSQMYKDIDRWTERIGGLEKMDE